MADKRRHLPAQATTTLVWCERPAWARKCRSGHEGHLIFTWMAWMTTTWWKMLWGAERSAISFTSFLRIFIGRFWSVLGFFGFVCLFVALFLWYWLMTLLVMMNQMKWWHWEKWSDYPMKWWGCEVMKWWNVALMLWRSDEINDIFWKEERMTGWNGEMATRTLSRESKGARFKGSSGGSGMRAPFKGASEYGPES